MVKKAIKYIFISGGVISGLGKGTITSSISRLLEDNDYRVSPIKIDMYLNLDAGTIRPQEHGEVFVLDDGLECDQDLGNYERFLGRSLNRSNYITSGQIYYAVIKREREFGYNGEDVELIPHITDEIISRLKRVGKEQEADIVIVELGGTVGEYQNSIFFEASRLLKLENPLDVIHIHVSYLIIPASLGEMKTKPVQQSVMLLNSMGIQPDFIITRSELDIDELRRKKIAMYCNIPSHAVISNPDIDSIYKVPLILAKQKLDQQIIKKLNLAFKFRTNHNEWTKFINRLNKAKNKEPIKIGIVGKYFKIGDFHLRDVYISVLESLKHAGWYFSKNIELIWIDSEDIEKGNYEQLKNIKGMVVPGGFGERGIEGILKAIEYARTEQIPYLGLCYGMQLATVEFARNVCNLKDANTTEINPETANPVIHIIPEQEKKLLAKEYGGSMRLGAYPAVLKENTVAYKAYKTKKISERHRHRYEFNNKYKKILKDNGMVFSGTSPDGNIVEIIEIENHPFFVASQFHPEFKSAPINPNPLFKKFIESCIKNEKCVFT